MAIGSVGLYRYASARAADRLLPRVPPARPGVTQTPQRPQTRDHGGRRFGDTGGNEHPLAVVPEIRNLTGTERAVPNCNLVQPAVDREVPRIRAVPPPDQQRV